MIETRDMSDRVDRYLRGEFDADETVAFETELLESPQLQDALEVALGLQRALEFDRRNTEGKVVRLHSGQGNVIPSSTRWRSWSLAASISRVKNSLSAAQSMTDESTTSLSSTGTASRSTVT